MPVRDDSVREEIMQVGGTPLRVAIRPGTGTGPPLLLCNGIGMRLEAFRPFVDALDPAIEVIRFDAPGVGGSQLPNLPYRFTTLALLLREMLHNLGHQQADVLGISWGGGLAQQFALLNPRLCRRLVLVATATGPQTMVPPNPLPPVKNLILRRWGDLWGGSARTDPEALVSALHKARISPLSMGFVYQNTAALGFTTLPLLPLIRQRTLVLTGDDDPIIPVANGRILAAGIPHATLHVYHGGHVELATRPGLLTPLITDFLAAPPHDARRAGQVQTGRHPEHQGPRQAADGTAAAQTAQAAQATAEADALAEAIQAARAAQQAAETAAAQAAAALRDAREQAATAQSAARELAAAPEGTSALCAGEGAQARRGRAVLQVGCPARSAGRQPDGPHRHHRGPQDAAPAGGRRRHRGGAGCDLLPAAAQGRAPRRAARPGAVRDRLRLRRPRLRVCGMYVEDLDLRPDDEHARLQGKGGTVRTVLLDDQGYLALLRLYLARSGYTSGPQFRASVNGRGGLLSYDAAHNRWKKYFAAAGTGIGIHQLRHAHASELINSGVSIEVVRPAQGGCSPHPASTGPLVLAIRHEDSLSCPRHDAGPSGICLRCRHNQRLDACQTDR